MKIYAKSKVKNDEYYNRLPLPSQVKRLGKYLKDNLAGVYDVKEPPNEYIIYDTILYQIKKSLRQEMKEYPELEGIEERVYDKNYYFNITTYQQYIRINIIQLDKYEKTVGFLRFDQKDLISLPYCKRKLLDYVKKVISKEYKGYEVLLVNEDT